MDIDIEKQVSAKRKKRIVAVSGVVILLIVAGVFGLRATLGTTIAQNGFSTAVVETGDIENTITAVGEVVPEFEEVVSSPIVASIRAVMKNSGTTVAAGEAILSLDKSATANEMTKQEFQLESKKNNIRKLRLELDKSFYDIRSNNEIKQLRINSLMAEVENAKRLFKAGGGTQEDIDKAELDLKVAKLEKQQLENEIKNKQQTMQVEMRESEIEAAIQQNSLAELKRRFNNADITATRTGVITWVNKNIGAQVTEGEAIARIADLSGFKVSGSISDNFLGELQEGMPAIVKINESTIRGKVSQVYPSVQNNIVTFDVSLDTQATKLLRPNLKVDVYLVTNAKKNILRVTNGQAFRGGAQEDVFILEDGRLKKRRISSGLSNFDYIEVSGNIKAGDRVVTSDMSRFKNVNEITISKP
ncbi:MAG: HlyD family efflux transporter periplasmic adaptor subunit [Chitinophagaceae bacterium]|nr:MAG: HlyD family efflux transporter periplasmic adaptor subunit [Chitinophagaceae bacterium]